MHMPVELIKQLDLIASKKMLSRAGVIRMLIVRSLQTLQEDTNDNDNNR